jgi:hypothetical protein
VKVCKHCKDNVSNGSRQENLPYSNSDIRNQFRSPAEQHMPPTSLTGHRYVPYKPLIKLVLCVLRNSTTVFD